MPELEAGRLGWMFMFMCKTPVLTEKKFRQKYPELRIKTVVQDLDINKLAKHGLYDERTDV